MSQIREIVVTPKAGDSVRSEFERFLTAAGERGWDRLEVLFGWAWGDCVYEGDWKEEVVSPEELRSRVDSLEADGGGSIGADDLFVTVLMTGVQSKFCHENDIDIEGFSDNEFIEKEGERYRSLGWELCDRTEAREPGSDEE